MSAMEHVRYLAETIGPRGSTREKESEAARYAEGVLRKIGFEPVTEQFSSARSAWYPYALFAGLVLVGEVLFWLGGQWGAIAALVLTVLSLASVLLELAFRPNPLRWLLPKGRSQNVWVRVPPRETPREQVVLVGHLDSHRTPLIFSTPGWTKLFGALVPIGLVCVIVLCIVFAIGSVSAAPIWRFVSLPFALVVLGLLLITLQADLTQFTAGANDNATGAGVVLSLAARLKQEPLAHTTVWAVLSGCEEVGCYGADAFAIKHKEDLRNTAWVAIDGVGGGKASPSYLKSETFLLTTHADPGLTALLERVAHRFPELDAHSTTMRGAYTEGCIGAKYGFRVLSVLSHRRDGVLPEWHRVSDVTANLDPDVVIGTEKLLWEWLQELDRERGQAGSP